jgi:hypothetical protein
MVLSWPTNFGTYGLEANTNLPATNWSAVTPAPAVVGGQFIVTNNISTGKSVYRLKSP